jgi:hypothetical protein
MLDDNDIKKLVEAQKEIFVTKEEFEGLIDIVATKEELNGLKGEMKQGFNKIGEDVKEIKTLLIDFGTRTKTLEGEVDFIKNSLNIQPLKISK